MSITEKHNRLKIKHNLSRPTHVIPSLAGHTNFSRAKVGGVSGRGEGQREK